ncbi:MAG TPA: EamA family transporter [Terriglobales bacterium]|jgi:transporter family protein|nr:EamA family transporter [Terriglobales bacterium]
MQFFLWLGLCLIVVIAWGVLGLFEKLATDHLAPAAALVWVAIGFMLLQAVAFPHVFWRYPTSSLIWALANGVLCAFGFLALLLALRHGGKVSIVEPLSALYPVLVAFLTPHLFGERASLQHSLGIACAVAAIVLLTADTKEIRESGRT